MKPIQQSLHNLKRLSAKIDPRLFLAVLIAVVIFMSSSSLWLSKAAAPTPTSQPAQIEISAQPSPTPFPIDYLRNEEQTIGPTVAAFLLVLVVVAAVLSHIRRKPTP